MKRGWGDNQDDSHNSDDCYSDGAACTNARQQRRIFRACASSPAAAEPVANIREASSDEAAKQAAVTAITQQNGGPMQAAETAITQQHRGTMQAAVTAMTQQPGGPMQAAVKAMTQQHISLGAQQESVQGADTRRVAYSGSEERGNRLSWADYVWSRERMGITVLSAKTGQSHAAPNRRPVESGNDYSAASLKQCAFDSMEQCARTPMEGRASFDRPIEPMYTMCTRAVIPDLNLPASCEDPGLAARCQSVGYLQGECSSNARRAYSDPGVRIAECGGSELCESYSPETVLSWRCCGITSCTSSSPISGSGGAGGAPPLLPPPPATPAPPPAESSSSSLLWWRSPHVNSPRVSCSRISAAASSSGVV
ncbi:unnamed protein product [Closterium sp. NIES-54]